MRPDTLLAVALLDAGEPVKATETLRLDGWRMLYQPDASRRHDGLADSLTPREHSVLELIAGGRSNQETAKSLQIAPETVKSHVKNIFGKLSVEKRAQAIGRAQSVGLLRTGVP